VGVRLVDLCLKGKYKTIRCAMYYERSSIYLKTRSRKEIGSIPNF
jgi:hypothetical protein